VEFRASCRLADAANKVRTLEFSDTIPKRFALAAAAVACRVRNTDPFGRLTVELLTGEQVIAADSTRQPFNWVAVQSAGPWGSASASHGQQRSLTVGPRPPEQRPPSAPAPSMRHGD
jgi:hypothetical protein